MQLDYPVHSVTHGVLIVGDWRSGVFSLCLEVRMTNAAQVIDAELSQDELLATKLFRPAPRQDLVHRSRLTEDLGAGLSAPLTVVVAPAGWGKTTLLADWLSAQGRRGPASGPALPSVAWVTLDEGDNDLIRFLRYLISALQTIEADFGRPALSRLQSAQPRDSYWVV
jgi:ATP/maltotriose-dependent transcriptional regulator MalT